MMLLSLECNGCKATVTADSNHLPTAQRKKETAATDGRRVENGERNGRVCPPSKNCCKKIGTANTKTRKKMASHSDSSEFCCTSSVGSCDAAAAGGFFGGGDDKEAAAILSSASFSSDSAEYYSHPSSSTTRIKNKHKNNTPTKRRGAGACDTKRKEEVVAVDVERGVAVERLSTDLYGDFRRSMVEMIMARRKLRAGDMECLLRCYLSLNSPEHHPVIIKAFSDIYRGYSLPLPTGSDF